ncbi:MAG: hypothetical protein AABN34_02585 [Acidobacteriota bacterium]
MKTITRLGLIAAAFTLALSSFALAGSKAERANKYFNIAGTVLQIDKREHTLLVADRSSAKLYLIEMPEGARFSVTFGRYMGMAEPGFDDVYIRDRVEIRCLRGDKEHLTRLEDGRSAIARIAAR